jgi:uncharacterized protein (DUF608 family)
MKSEQKIQELEKQIESLKKEVQKEEEMEQWFKSLLNGLVIEIKDDEPNSVFYKKDGRYFFALYQDIDNKEETYFLCHFYLVWALFYIKYELNNDEIREFIKNMAEKYLKLNGVKTSYRNFRT